jgi:hypothetical protein
MTARARLYDLGIVPRRARVSLAEWRRFRERYLAFLNRSVATGLFADRFAPGPLAEQAAPSFDGRVFRVRLPA